MTVTAVDDEGPVRDRFLNLVLSDPDLAARAFTSVVASLEAPLPFGVAEGVRSVRLGGQVRRFGRPTGP